MTKLMLTICLYVLTSVPLAAKDLSLSCPHKVIPLKVEVAATSEEQRKGLMYRTHLDSEGGMLFLFSQSAPVAMWMKNTLLPLDMIFADQTGKILAIYENTKPLSESMIGPVEGTSQVLEVLGGTVKKKGITKGCTLQLHS